MAQATLTRVLEDIQTLEIVELRQVQKAIQNRLFPSDNAPQEVSTQQAADFLMVSRSFLIEELLEKGVIPYRKVGNRRRIRYEDLRRYRQEEEREIARREQVMRELMAETERLGLYR